MMWELRGGDERGIANHGWLQSRHSFSFGDYFDRRHMGFSALRVINEDRVAPGQGFGTHGHQDMEILSYVLSGQLAHQDSMGNGSVIVPGDVQRMSAGRGVRHSEQNASATDMVHFLQIWILPSVQGIEPGYEQKHFPEADKRGRLRLVAAPDGADGAVTIHQDARLYAGLFDGGEAASHLPGPGRLTYLHVVRGAIGVNATRLSAGDALKTDSAAALALHDGADAEILVFDLPGGPGPA